MYLKEDKERILADLHASGLTDAVFSRIPGNPSRECLRKWRRQAESGELDVPVRKVRGRCDQVKHGRYPDTTKQEAFRLRKKGMRWCDIARKLNISSGGVAKSLAAQVEKSKMSHQEVLVVKKKKNNNDEPDITRTELEAELAEAQMENRVLRELMRNPKVGDPEKLSNMQKAELGEKLRRDFGYSQKQIIDFLKMPKSTYNYNKKRLMIKEARAELVLEHVRAVFEKSKRTYGYRRIRSSLITGTKDQKPFFVSEREVRDAMREGSMVARKTRKKMEYNSYAGEVDDRPANTLLCEDGTHDFYTSRPDEVVLTDVTEFKVGNKKVYLSPIIDCFDGAPVAWSISTHPNSALSDSSLKDF